MSMPTPATVAAQIVSDLGIVPAGTALATTQWTAILARIQTMISAGTVTVSTTIQSGAVATGVTTGSATVPVTGTATGTGTLT